MSRDAYKKVLANDFMTLKEIEDLMNQMNRRRPVHGPVEADGTWRSGTCLRDLSRFECATR
jgi:hypothetical protein